MQLVIPCFSGVITSIIQNLKQPISFMLWESITSNLLLNPLVKHATCQLHFSQTGSQMLEDWFVVPLTYNAKYKSKTVIAVIKSDFDKKKNSRLGILVIEIIRNKIFDTIRFLFYPLCVGIEWWWWVAYRRREFVIYWFIKPVKKNSLQCS